MIRPSNSRSLFRSENLNISRCCVTRCNDLFEPTSNQRNMPNPSVNPARILVVEDNQADVFLLRHALDEHGEEYQLEVLGDGAEAILFVEQQRVFASDPTPCAI